jgi:type I restriction enzyme S subunit
MRSPFVQEQMRRYIRASSQPDLGLDYIRQLTIPLPPLAEQRRIVAEVERRLSVVEEMEAAVEANLKRAERLRQTILKRAFEGTLVPQDPTDEPASVLLERIRAERDLPSAVPTKRRQDKRPNNGQQPRFVTLPLSEVFDALPRRARRSRGKRG